MSDRNPWQYDLAIAAFHSGIIDLPSGFWDWPRNVRLAWCEPAAAQLAARRREPSLAEFFSRCERLLPSTDRQEPGIAETRDIRELAVLTTFFNPCGYLRPLENFHRFRAGIEAAGLTLHIAELAFDEDPWSLDEGTLRIRGRRERNLLWQKERLLNLLLERLPSTTDAVAWIDADVLFLNPDWPSQVRDVLRTNCVSQLFADAYHLHPTGRLEFIAPSVASAFVDCSKRSQSTNLLKYHPGFAWAARRELIADNGFLDTVTTGGGDSLMLKGFTGRSLHGLENAMSDRWRNDAAQWAGAVDARCEGTLGCVPGSILHLWHGSKENRRYVDRWGYLTRHAFTPSEDLRLDDSGLWAWSNSARLRKPEMIQAVSGYFAERREDG